MKASIAGRIRNTNLPKAKTLLPLFEAVMNAFQAIEEAGGKGHVIRIIAERQGSLDEGKPGPIEAFTVIDSGIGFTDANFDSFETVDSPYKAPRGGKGLGRFLVAQGVLACRSREPFPRCRHGRAVLPEIFLCCERRRAAAGDASLRSPEARTSVRLVGYRTPYVASARVSSISSRRNSSGIFCPYSLTRVAQPSR